MPYRGGGLLFFLAKQCGFEDCLLAPPDQHLYALQVQFSSPTTNCAITRESVMLTGIILINCCSLGELATGEKVLCRNNATRTTAVMG